MTISAIVPAAGCGARAALNGNKILAPLLGKPLLFWTIQALHEAGIEEIIVAARREEFEMVREAAQIPVMVVEGGATRQESVLAGVSMAQNELVLVHDAARPCVSPEIIRKTCEAAQEYGAAIAAVPATDTVKIADAHSNISKTLDRREVWLAQTPQVFWRLRFHMALLEARRQGVEGTDCASLAEALGQKVRLVEGDLNNLKVTYAADLERAAAILKARL